MNPFALTRQISVKDIKSLVQLALPIIAAQIMQSLNGLVDTVMAGRHSADTLSQVAMGSSIWMPLMILSAGLFNGVSALASHAFGAGHKQELKTLFSSSLLLALLLSIIMMFLLQNASVIFPWFDVPNELAAGMSDYVTMVSLGFPLLLVFWALRGWVEGLHLTKPAMIASLVAVLLNIPLNYILIQGWWFIPEMGAKGCGVATAISMSTMPFIMLYLFKKDKILIQSNIFFKDMLTAIELKTIKKILVIGGPVGLSGFIEGSFFCVIAIMLAPLGAISVASHQITLNISSTLFMVPLGFNFALTIAIGKAYGEKASAERLRQLITSGLAVAIAFALTSCTFLLTCRALIPALYTSNLEVIALSSQLLLLAAFFQICDGLQVSLYGVLKGLQDTFVPMCIAIFAYWVFGAVLGYSFTYFETFGAMGAKGAWIGLNIGLFLSCLAYFIRMFYVFKKKTNQSFFG